MGKTSFFSSHTNIYRVVRSLSLTALVYLAAVPFADSALAFCNDNFFWNPTAGDRWDVNGNWVDGVGNLKNDWPNDPNDCVFLGVVALPSQNINLPNLAGVNEIELDTLVVGDGVEFDAVFSIRNDMSIRLFEVKEGHVEIDEDVSVHVHEKFIYKSHNSTIRSIANEPGEIWVYGIEGNVAEAIIEEAPVNVQTDYFDTRLVIGSDNVDEDGTLSFKSSSTLLLGSKADIDVLPGGKVDMKNMKVEVGAVGAGNPNSVDVQGKLVLAGTLNQTHLESSLDLPLVLDHLDDTYEQPSMLVKHAVLTLDGISPNGALQNIGGVVTLYPKNATGSSPVLVAPGGIQQIPGAFDLSSFIFGYDNAIASNLVGIKGDMLFTGGIVEFKHFLLESSVDGKWLIDGADMYVQAFFIGASIFNNLITLDDMSMTNADVHVTSEDLTPQDEFTLVQVNQPAATDFDVDNIIGTPYVGGHFEDSTVNVGNKIEYRLKAVDD